jgi:DNA-binding FadR family transcriptional regulator
VSELKEGARRLAQTLALVREALKRLIRRDWIHEKSGDTIATVDSETGRLVD